MLKIVFSSITAILIFLSGTCMAETFNKIVYKPGITKTYGGVTRGPVDTKTLALVFTGGSYADCGTLILNTLRKHNDAKANFFFIGEFLRKDAFGNLIDRIISDGHYIGPHSDAHLLYCPWENRSHTLVTKDEFIVDLAKNFDELAKFGVNKKNALLWIPPYEWYNDTISAWSDEYGLGIINLTQGTLAAADYTLDTDKNFRSNQTIYESIIKKEQTDHNGLNGYILLMHIGTAPGRTEKFATRLDNLMSYLEDKEYQFSRVDDMLLVKSTETVTVVWPDTKTKPVSVNKEK
ncbi:MAG: polysaccharide deacetylase family protein [Elusimicrobiota bacterium]